MKLRGLIASLIAIALLGTGLIFLSGTASADPDVRYIGPGPSYANPPEGVRCVQQAVGADMDGQFGQLTYGAVKQFQANNGLSVDGIVGPQTGDAVIATLPEDRRYDCAQDVPTSVAIMDDNGDIAGGGTAYNATPNGDPGGVVDTGKPIGTCLVKGIKSQFIGAGRIAKVIWKRRLPTTAELSKAPNPLTFGAGLIFCHVVG